MAKKGTIVAISVVAGLVVAAGLGVLIWWLVTRDTTHEDDVRVVLLEGDGIGDLPYSAAFTKINGVGDVFWWFYPTVASGAHSRPLILWLDGVIGVQPSLLANLGMFGPYDTNFNRRENSWVEQYNLLFIDAPLGTGFSTPVDTEQIPKNIDINAEHLAITLESFYTVHEDYRNSPLYIFGEGHGAQLAVALAINLYQNQNGTAPQLRGVALGNGIISPALGLTKLGFYLEELGYVDRNGRFSVEILSDIVNLMVDHGEFETAFIRFLSLGQYVDITAGAVAVNLDHIVEKLTREPSLGMTNVDHFGQREYLRNKLRNTDSDFMNRVVAPALGIPSNIAYDSGREEVIEAFKGSFMIPATDKVEYILQNTDLTVAIYNGNLDAVSNTPGQLEWVNNLQWPGQQEFNDTPRETLVVNRLVQGYFRNTTRLHFYWVNVAGQSAPLDNPDAMRTVVRRIVENP